MEQSLGRWCAADEGDVVGAFIGLDDPLVLTRDEYRRVGPWGRNVDDRGVDDVGPALGVDWIARADDDAARKASFPSPASSAFNSACSSSWGSGLSCARRSCSAIQRSASSAWVRRRCERSRSAHRPSSPYPSGTGRSQAFDPGHRHANVDIAGANDVRQ